MTQQTLFVDIHHPRVIEMRRQESGTLVVTLGNGPLNGSVDVFLSDAEWAALRAEVDSFLTREQSSLGKKAWRSPCRLWVGFW